MAKLTKDKSVFHALNCAVGLTKSSNMNEVCAVDFDNDICIVLAAGHMRHFL